MDASAPAIAGRQQALPSIGELPLWDAIVDQNARTGDVEQRFLADRVALNGDDDFTRPIRTPDNRMAAVYFRAESPLDADRRVLVDILCAAVGVGLDNVYLHERLLSHQARLEAEVAARTLELATINADLMQTQRQQSILPAAFPFHHSYEGRAFMRQAHMIGGDFYDMFHLDEHRLGIVVADVSGKGAPAALFMVLVRTVLQEVALGGLAPGACLAEANRRLIARNPLSLFVTVLYGVMDARTGLFTFCSGGHVMPYVLRAGGDVEAVSAGASPLVGLIEGADYPDLTIALRPGDGLLLLTDGVAECFNRAGEQFGERRLIGALAAVGAITVDRVLDGLIAELDRFSDGLLSSPPAFSPKAAFENSPGERAGSVLSRPLRGQRPRR